jgi:hypothetical protein
MVELSSPFSPRKTRIGFHYFSDALHYRESDLKAWIPRLKLLGASWIMLRSPSDRSIPEEFIRMLVQEEIEPVIQFNYNMGAAPGADQLEETLSDYARWGANAVVFFDRPNSQRSWPSQEWAQNGLVERFLDRFLPIANLALCQGLTPLMPPLEPGGSYWDTTFFRAMLESLIRRKEVNLLQNLVIGAYAWTFGRPLNWGAGGPERWPGARPYHINSNSQDQCGFRAYDWYQAVARALLGKSVPVMLFQAGVHQDPLVTLYSALTGSDESAFLAIGRLLQRESVNDPGGTPVRLEPLPDEILAGFFWLLSADSFSPYLPQAWFRQDGCHSVQVDQWIEWVKQIKTVAEFKSLNHPSIGKSVSPHTVPKDQNHPIAHYLLLPVYEWGIADWHWEVIRPFVKKYQPAVGFSIEEAGLAARVTIIGNEQTFPESLLEHLRINGAFVERISGSGTNIATQLSER